jgi:hypothetical protein
MFMDTKIETLEDIGRLKRGQIIYQAENKEKYCIDTIKDDFLILVSKDPGTVLKLIYFRNLLEENWHIQQSEFQAM